MYFEELQIGVLRDRSTALVLCIRYNLTLHRTYLFLFNNFILILISNLNYREGRDLNSTWKHYTYIHTYIHTHTHTHTHTYIYIHTQNSWYYFHLEQLLKMNKNLYYSLCFHGIIRESFTSLSVFYILMNFHQNIFTGIAPFLKLLQN